MTRFTTTFDPLNFEDPEAPGKEAHPTVGLLHELRHAYDKSKPIVYNALTDWHDAETGERVMFSKWEAQAINSENILRRVLYGDIRTTYIYGGRKLRAPKRLLTNYYHS